MLKNLQEQTVTICTQSHSAASGSHYSRDYLGVRIDISVIDADLLILEVTGHFVA